MPFLLIQNTFHNYNDQSVLVHDHPAHHDFALAYRISRWFGKGVGYQARANGTGAISSRPSVGDGILLRWPKAGMFKRRKYNSRGKYCFLSTAE